MSVLSQPPSFFHELMAAQGRGHDAQVGPTGIVAPVTNLGRGKDRVADKNRTGVAAGDVDDIADRVVGHVRAGQPQTQVEGQAAVHDQPAADIFVRVLVDQVLVGVDLRGVVEHGGEVHVGGGHGPAA